MQNSLQVLNSSKRSVSPEIHAEANDAWAHNHAVGANNVKEGKKANRERHRVANPESEET